MRPMPREPPGPSAPTMSAIPISPMSPMSLWLCEALTSSVTAVKSAAEYLQVFSTERDMIGRYL